jgi:hypothetical protein
MINVIVMFERIIGNHDFIRAMRKIGVYKL